MDSIAMSSSEVISDAEAALKALAKARVHAGDLPANGF